MGETFIALLRANPQLMGLGGVAIAFLTAWRIGFRSQSDLFIGVITKNGTKDRITRKDLHL